MLTCQRDDLNPLTFYLTVSYSAQQHASIWHCLPQACLLYLSIQSVPSQIGKAWPKFLHFRPLIYLLSDLHPGNRNNHLIYMIPNKKMQGNFFLLELRKRTRSKYSSKTLGNNANNTRCTKSTNMNGI